VPGAHRTHAVELEVDENIPEMQFAQGGSPVVENWPAAQTPAVEHEVAPSREKVPVEHVEHNADPEAAYFPAVHIVQADELETEYVPGAHEEHEDEPIKPA